MELNKYIEETLYQIAKGVQNAHNNMSKENLGKVGITRKQIKFDIAITSTGKNETKGGAKINVYDIVSIGGDKGLIKENSSVNKIQFEVMMEVEAFKTGGTGISVI